MEEQKTPESKVYILSCRAHFPFLFASHTWFVIERGGMTLRYEVLYRKNSSIKELGHLHMNSFGPFQGIPVFSFTNKFFWRSRPLGEAHGALADKISDIILGASTTYPYKDTYFALGPNSNTFASWVLKQVPEWNVILPGDAIGKKYGI